jgi:curli biogenesis system outer membrane secretion channel CsgG
MKNLSNRFCRLLILAFGLMLSQGLIAQGSDVTIEKVKEKCKGIPREQRLRITVTRFTVSSRAAQATGQFGEELTAIMTNAIQQTNCFRVLESAKNKADLDSELGYNESGATDGSGPKRGQQQGAQAIVTAEITEYSEGRSQVGLLGVNVGSNSAKIGLIVKVLDPQTRDLLWSKSVNGKGEKNGLKGATIFGVNVAGSSKLSEAMSAAVEDICLRTVDLLVKEKEEILSNFDLGPAAKPKVWTRENCSLLSSGNAPKIMVILPEKHINRYLTEASCETELLRKFLEAGFKAVDPAMYATLRNGARFSEAVKNPTAAISLGKEFGADIVIFGEGVSQYVSREGNTVTCRAQVDAKAVRTDNAEIVATNSAQAGGQDIAESTSAKTALKNAGGQLANYFLDQLCGGNATNAASSGGGVAASAASTTIITVKETNFTKLNNLSTKLKGNAKVKDLKKELKGNSGIITLQHEGTSDDIATLISGLGAEYEITEMESGKITVVNK